MYACTDGGAAGGSILLLQTIERSMLPIYMILMSTGPVKRSLYFLVPAKCWMVEGIMMVKVVVHMLERRHLIRPA